ncbi:energy transducer TonB [Mucilaginibacter pedocola]|uniref:TonB C-terminal domain-containing protein n=1 Tax=Mucilaginibacter pedocola TaxID=1792845 RepID=A0A1S9PB11_9SPHI|nr:energy transducer TonB [Mucilaginibacter pedocola]OOQ58166.1 hypothetical protein BC343_10980 [Mucilaginibacter pedocola]
MKLAFLTLSFLLISCSLFAQEVPNIPENPEVKKDSATLALEATNSQVFVEQQASFGTYDNAFVEFVAGKTTTPELVNLFGFKGRIVISFTVQKDGRLKNIQALSESGTGFEKNILATVAAAPFWKPAIQNGRPVEQTFTMPFRFDISRADISMKELKKSSYKFNFQIGDKVYSINEAEPILGSTFSSARIDYIKSFLEQPEENRKSKKCLIKIKD